MLYTPMEHAAALHTWEWTGYVSEYLTYDTYTTTSQRAY